MSKQAVLTEFDLNGLKLRNRVVMAPMTRSRAENPEKKPTANLHGKYYQQRASAGLLIAEGSPVSAESIGYVNVPGIYTDAQTQAWKEVTKMVHEDNGRIFLQLWHVGRISHPDFHNGNKPLAPSAINPHAKSFTPKGFKDTVTPKAMSQEDIARTVQDFKRAAKNAMEANFDGIEIHSSNGYLFHQFFNNFSNTREDKYGGSIENKTRFFFEVLDAVKEVMPENKIGVRFNPSLHGIFGMEMDAETIPTFEYLLKKLNDYNLAYVHLSEPFNDVSNVPHAVENIAQHFRPIYKGNLMINTSFDQEKANKVIEDGNADLVAFGKPFISNPDLAERFAQNIKLSNWDKDTFYTGGEKGYLDYERKTETIRT